VRLAKRGYGVLQFGERRKESRWRRLERVENGKQRKLELNGEKKNSQKTIISQREGEKEELAGKGIEKKKEVRYSVDIDILKEVKREIKECKDGLKKEVEDIKKRD